MKFLRKFRALARSIKPHTVATIAVLGIAATVVPQEAFAQDPFAKATGASQSVANSLKTFALAVGAIGMISCLLLGFFGKLNWKWISTGVGVSFALAIVVPAINWLNSLG